MPVLELETAPHVSPVSTDNKASYRPDIDGLRAIAIIVVVAFHAHVPLFNGGFVGVDIFLVISGYLIGSLVYREVSETRFSFLRFYERRVKRILPALLAVLFVCNAIAYVLLSPLELRDYCAQSFSAVTSTSNIFYWLRSNYFAPAAALKPLLMTWSLGIEEQFYLLFPLAIFLLHRFTKNHVFRWVALATGVSFAVSAIWVNYYPAAAFYLLPTRAWELGVGVLLAIWHVQGKRRLELGTTGTNAVGWLGMAMIFVSVLGYNEGVRFPGFAALLPVAGAALLVETRDSFVNCRLLASRPIVFIGLISYSWYLWHWPLMSFSRIVTGDLLSVPKAVLIAVFSLLLAVLSQRFIEKPFRWSQTPALRLRLSYAILLLAFAATPLIGYVRKGLPGRTPGLAKLEAAVSDAQENQCLAAYDVAKARLAAPCVEGPAGPKLVVLGDSHAAALGPALRQIATARGYGFEMLTKATCPPLAGSTRRLTFHPQFEQVCASFNQTSLQHIVNDPGITVVVLAGYWSSPWSETVRKDYYSETSHMGKAVSDTESYENLHSGLLKTITLLRTAGKHVFVVTDVPRFDPDPMSNVRNLVIKARLNVASMLSSHVFSLDSVPKDSLTTVPDNITDQEVRQAALDGGAQLIDLARNICPDANCRFWDKGALLYSDSNHLSAYGAMYALQGQEPISSQR
jgi:peptidoglycan/LPS O-acetylase OafA/YrhL